MRQDDEEESKAYDIFNPLNSVLSHHGSESGKSSSTGTAGYTNIDTNTLRQELVLVVSVKVSVRVSVYMSFRAVARSKVGG